MVQRKKKRVVLTEEVKQIRKQEEEIELRRIEEENKMQEVLNQQIREEEEKIREERQDYPRQQRRPKLTVEQRRLRAIILNRVTRHRARVARAAIDDKFRQKIEAGVYGGGESRYQRWRCRPSKLTDEQKKIRARVNMRMVKSRMWTKKGRGQPKVSAINENFDTEKEATNRASHEADLLRPGDLPADELPGSISNSASTSSEPS